MAATHAAAGDRRLIWLLGALVAFGPLADASRVVQIAEMLSCKPCTLHGRTACPLGHYQCAWGIQVDELAQL